MKRNINPKPNVEVAAPVSVLNYNGTLFYEYGKTAPIGLIWTNNGQAMFISTVISGGMQVRLNIDGNIIPVISATIGQVIPLNLYVPNNIVITITNDYNSLIISGIKLN